jgi:Type I restriction enzyme R protein N terminus (HSDR_N)
METMALSALKPEEVIRQKFKAFLKQKGFNDSILLQEKALSELPHLKGVPFLPYRRVDILAYACIEGVLKPLLLVECKDKKITDEALYQVLGYNHYIKAPYVALVAGSGYVIYDTLKNTWMDTLLDYDTLILQASDPK